MGHRILRVIEDGNSCSQLQLEKKWSFQGCSGKTHLEFCKQVFDSISSNIDEVLSINPSALCLSLEGLMPSHHNDRLTCPGGTDRSGELL